MVVLSIVSYAARFNNGNMGPLVYGWDPIPCRHPTIWRIKMNQSLSVESLRASKKEAPGSRAARMSIHNGGNKQIAEPRLFTRSIQTPTIWATLQETRFRIRVLQFFSAIGMF